MKWDGVSGFNKLLLVCSNIFSQNLVICIFFLGSCKNDGHFERKIRFISVAIIFFFVLNHHLRFFMPFVLFCSPKNVHFIYRLRKNSRKQINNREKKLLRCMQTHVHKGISTFSVNKIRRKGVRTWIKQSASSKSCCAKNSK